MDYCLFAWTTFPSPDAVSVLTQFIWLVQYKLFE